MSTASQRRKARREHLQRPFADKVHEVALALPRRRPEVTDGMRYVKRIEDRQPFKSEIAKDTPYPRRTLWLRDVVGSDTDRVPRTFRIAYSDPLRQQLGFGGDRIWPEIARTTIDFTWRQWAVRAGDTEVRWLVPELTGNGASDSSHAAFCAARKVIGYAERAMRMFRDREQYGTQYMPEAYVRETTQDAIDAMNEFIGVIDSPETRHERESETA